MLKNLELTIPQFYDITEPEIQATRLLFDECDKTLIPYGYREIKTSLIRDYKYLAATKVHFSKIFEVHRPRQGSVFLLQSDLAMSMSEYVSRIKFPRVLKLFQMGTLLRDRVDNLPGYRREFQQLLSGVWGSASLYYDAELIYLNYLILKKLNCYGMLRIQLSNFNILNAVCENLAESIRFEGIDGLFSSIYLSDNDKKLIQEYFSINEFDASFLYKFREKIQSNVVQQEIDRLIEVFNRLKLLLQQETVDIRFSINNLAGTGHYSGLHYRIYADDVLIVDGGRIDDMCRRFDDSKNIPAVCMGMGVQMVVEKIAVQPRSFCTILISSADFEKNIQGLLFAQNEIMKLGFVCSIIPLKRKQWGDVFTNEYYCNSIFVLCLTEKIEIRNAINDEQKNIILKIMQNKLTTN